MSPHARGEVGDSHCEPAEELIQQRILAHATDPARDRFEELVRVPRGRNMDPHADHFHVRIFCPEADVAHGCLDGRR